MRWLLRSASAFVFLLIIALVYFEQCGPKITGSGPHILPINPQSSWKDNGQETAAGSLPVAKATSRGEAALSFAHQVAARQHVEIAHPVSVPASLTIGGQTFHIEPNASGMYPIFTVPAGKSIPIHLSMQPGDTVQEQSLDGGQLNGKSRNQTQTADDQGGVTFSYATLDAPGMYHVAVASETTRGLLSFWVGPNLPQRVSSQ